MSIRARNKTAHGFTLLEVMLATMIVGLLTSVLFRFVSTNLQAMKDTS